MNNIDVLLNETRSFPPPASFSAHARVNDQSLHNAALADPDAFWATEAAELEWSRPWDSVMNWTPPHVQWFSGYGESLIDYNHRSNYIGVGVSLVEWY